MVVLTCFVMCGCFGNMCTCIYCVLYCLYCVLVLFCSCTFSFICFVCTCVRTAAPSDNLIAIIMIIIIIIIKQREFHRAAHSP